MQQVTLSEAQAFCLEHNIPFYSYRLPDRKEVFFGASGIEKVKVFEQYPDFAAQDGFIAVPFSEQPGIPAFFIPAEITLRDVADREDILSRLVLAKRRPIAGNKVAESVSREEYHQQVTTMISALQAGEVRKVVLARGLTEVTEGFRHAPQWFERLSDHYADAFVFLVSVPGVMTWMGATPEIFLQQTEEGVETMALAGTRPAGTKGAWGDKETEEQGIVADYIANQLKDEGAWNTAGPFSYQAGKVEHLCTSFHSAGSLSAGQVECLRRTLHPTPAVGGFPTREAVDMIQRIEGDKRRYYAGYIGPVRSDHTFHWYVNLRSMEIFPEAVHLYIGGGITALSEPEKEWEETVLKSHTLLDIIYG